MKIYVAARIGRRAEVRDAVAPMLRSAGHTVVSRWHDKEDPPGRVEADMDIADLDASDIVAVLTDPVGTLNPGGGRWFEMGYGFAKNKIVFAVGEPEIIFCHLAQVVCCPDAGSLVKILTRARTIRSIRLCEILCRAHGTAQCAALCLTHSSLGTTDGQCPEQLIVWGHKARAIAAETEEWPDVRASVILAARTEGNQDDPFDERAAGYSGGTGGDRDRSRDLRPGPED